MKNLNLQNLNLNEEIEKHLQSAFSQDRLPHAVILAGSLQSNRLGETLEFQYLFMASSVVNLKN